MKAEAISYNSVKQAFSKAINLEELTKTDKKIVVLSTAILGAIAFSFYLLSKNLWMVKAIIVGAMLWKFSDKIEQMVYRIAECLKKRRPSFSFFRPYPIWRTYYRPFCRPRPLFSFPSFHYHSRSYNKPSLISKRSVYRSSGGSKTKRR